MRIKFPGKNSRGIIDWFIKKLFYIEYNTYYMKSVNTSVDISTFWTHHRDMILTDIYRKYDIILT